MIIYIYDYIYIWLYIYMCVCVCMCEVVIPSWPSCELNFRTLRTILVMLLGKGSPVIWGPNLSASMSIWSGFPHHHNQHIPLPLHHPHPLHSQRQLPEWGISNLGCGSKIFQNVKTSPGSHRSWSHFGGLFGSQTKRPRKRDIFRWVFVPVASAMLQLMGTSCSDGQIHPMDSWSPEIHKFVLKPPQSRPARNIQKLRFNRFSIESYWVHYGSYGPFIFGTNFRALLKGWAHTILVVCCPRSTLVLSLSLSHSFRFHP